MKKLLYLTTLAAVLSSCAAPGTGSPQISEHTRERLNAALDRLAVTTISLGEAAAAAHLSRLGSKVIPSGK